MRRSFIAAATLSCLAGLICTGVAVAQMPIPPSTQFDITGFLEEATLGGPGTGLGTGPHQGGTLKVNGHTVIGPSETIVILPASALTWAELFSAAPAPYTGIATGMAFADVPAPLTTYEVHVVGNRLCVSGPNCTGTGDVYIAGLVNISQQALNSGAGFINFMDYATGELRVGGIIGDPGTGTRVRLNDPVARFGRAMSPDTRFTSDDANPTIAAATGFPMCFPRVTADPNVAGNPDDSLCPHFNRPKNLAGNFETLNVQMSNPVTLPGVFPDATKQAPFEVGDYVTFAGTRVADAGLTAGPTAGPWPGIANTYISAHTVSGNVAIYTWPGTNPAYVAIEVSLIGTGGLTILGLTEAVTRSRFEGMTTDPSRNIHLYGVDVFPGSGATSDRDFGTIAVDPGAPTGAVKGRWRFRPPCAPFGSAPSVKQCVMNSAGTFLPPPREVRAVIEGLQSQNPANPLALTAANGIFYGQYHAPIAEYIFPEPFPGAPIVENNFNTLDFLARGGYTSALLTVAGVLNPWPSNAPPPGCVVPVANAGGPYTVAAGGATITLNGTATGTGPFSFAWTASAGSFDNPALPNPVFTAPASGTVNLTLTAFNSCGPSAPATTTLGIGTQSAPVVSPVAPITVLSGAAGSFIVSGTDPNGALPLRFTVTQAGTPALTVLTVVPLTSTSATVNFVAPAVPVGQVTPDVITLTITARNTVPLSSVPVTTTITVNPSPDVLFITNAEYRTGKSRLTVSATSSVISPNVNLFLNPYACAGGISTICPGGTFDPATLGNTFTNSGGGLYIITLVGAPEPAVPPATPLSVRSNLNGISPLHGLDRIRN